MLWSRRRYLLLPFPRCFPTSSCRLGACCCWTGPAAAGSSWRRPSPGGRAPGAGFGVDSLRRLDSGGADSGLDGLRWREGGHPRAKAARDAALGEVVEVRGRCKELEAELQGLRDQLEKEVCL